MSRKKTLIEFILCIIGLYLFYYLVFHKAVPCLFHEVTGLYCPGCGITRLCLSLLQFDFYQAFRFNPYVFFLLLITPLYLLFSWMYKEKTQKKFQMPNGVYVFILITLIFFGILRNIPFFSYLAPTIVK